MVNTRVFTASTFSNGRRSSFNISTNKKFEVHMSSSNNASQAARRVGLIVFFSKSKSSFLEANCSNHGHPIPDLAFNEELRGSFSSPNTASSNVNIRLKVRG
nr:hypothetical protein [signal crayfish associated picorna-like virus 5]